MFAPHVPQLVVGHSVTVACSLISADQRGGYAPFPVGRIGGVGEVELAEVYVVGQFYPTHQAKL
jgi:hypothetical protein